MRPRAIALLAVAALLSVALSGCENFGQFAPLAASRDGDTLLIAVCTDIDVTELLVEQRDTARGNEWSDLWKGDGLASIHSGDVIRMPGDVAGLSPSSSRTPTYADSVELSLLLVASDENKTLLGGFEHLGQLKAGQWITPRGDKRASPCAAPGS
jgi:hypothetical protein